MIIKEFKLEEFLAKFEFNVKYTLCSSDCESFNIKEVLNLENYAWDNFNDLWLGYTETVGNLSLRQEIINLYDTILPEEVIVFSGAEEGIFIFMNALLKKGDHVIVQFPAYQSLYEVADSIGCKITKWTMEESNEWDLNLDFLESQINKKTKCIIINSPHNPTGYMFSKKNLETIIDIAKEKDIYIFSDEVYRFLEYDSNQRNSALSDCYQKGISLGVMSKAFGLPGLRIGWITTKDRNLYKKLASFKNYTTICNSAPSEFLSILALKHKDIILQRNLRIISENLKMLNDFFNKYTDLFKWIKPTGGSTTFPKILTDEDVENFCLNLINQKSVLLLPSTKFDFGNKHFRIGFGRKNMPEALHKLEEFIQQKY